MLIIPSSQQITDDLYSAVHRRCKAARTARRQYRGDDATLKLSRTEMETLIAFSALPAEYPGWMFEAFVDQQRFPD